MKLDSKYINVALSVLENTMRESRKSLSESHGNIEYSVKKDQTIVTRLDRMVEDSIIRELLKLDTTVGIFGEETGRQGDQNIYWLIDPIDGTEQFVRGLPGCATMVCLVVKDVPTVSMIYDFMQDELYVARKGYGASKNGQPIRVSSRPIEKAWVDFAFRRDQLELSPNISKLIASTNIVRLRNSLLTSTGNIDGLIVVNGKGGLWDYAPRMLMISEAGGRVANIGTDTYDFHNTSFIASNPVIFDKLQEIMSSTNNV